MEAKIIILFRKYREILLYLIFGILTVVFNTVIYLALSSVLEDIIANTIAFIIAVQFAYLTNTKFVFNQSSTKDNFLKFWGMRIGTLLIDNGGMWILLYLGINKLLAKCFVNIVIIVLNYIFSKFIIFRNERN
jgi:putative flippase GtrA